MILFAIGFAVHVLGSLPLVAAQEITELEQSSAWTGKARSIRATLKESGITFRGTSTHYAFGIDGGINVPVSPPLGQGDAFKYTGRERYNLTLDLDKLNWAKASTLNIRAENWYGEYGNVGVLSGAFAPPLFPTVLPPSPNDPGIPKLTGFFVTRRISDRLVLFGGKNDVLGDVDQDVFAGGDGTQQFMNQSFVVNPAFLLAMPYSHFNFGVFMPREWGNMGLIIYDAKDRTDDFFKFNDLFAEGVIVLGQIEIQSNFFNRPGRNRIAVAWKHLDLPDLRFGSDTLGDYPYEEASGVPTKSDSFVIFGGFDQLVFKYADASPIEGRGRLRSARGIGIFGRAAVTDGNPNPVRYYLATGIAGDSRLRQGSGDTFGIGWYYNGVSSQFGTTTRNQFGPRDGTGLEAFYNIQLTPRLNVSPDIQYIRPGAGAIASDSFIYGLRINITL